MKRRIKRPFNRRNRKDYVLIFAMIVVGFSLGYATAALPLAHKLETELGEYRQGIWPWDWFRSDGYDYYNGSDSFGNGQGDADENSVLKDGSNNFDKRWNIGFTDAVKTATIGSASEATKPKVSKENVEFSVLLMEPGDAITYTITIKNMGVIDAKIASIRAFLNNDYSDAIIYKVEGLQVGDTLNAGKTKKVKITAIFDNNYTTMPKSTVTKLSMKILYVQK